MTHAAPRIKNAPAKNFVISEISGNAPDSEAIAKLHADGKNTNHIPTKKL